MSTLDAMKLPKLLRNKLKALALGLSNSDDDSVSGGAEVVRVDASKGGKYAITFLNNLEKDASYKRWPKTVRQLLYPSWSLHTIAKNLYTAVIVVDPLTTEGAGMLLQVQMLLQQEYPIRFGVSLDCSESTSGLHEYADSKDVCVLFGRIKESYGTVALSGFLFRLAGVVAGDMYNRMFGSDSDSDDAAEFAGISRQELIQLFASTVAENEGVRSDKTFIEEAKKLLTSTDENGISNDFVVNSTEYLNSRGFPRNSFSLNGIVTSSSDIGNSLMQLLGREQFILSKMVQEGVLTDKVRSIFSLLLETSGGYDRYHPLLEETEPVYSDLTQSSSRYFLNYLYCLPFSSCNPALPRSVISNLDFFSPENSKVADSNGRYKLHNTTIVFFASTEIGLRTALASLQWLNESTMGAMRVALVVNIPTDIQSCLVSSSANQQCPDVDPIGVAVSIAIINSLGKIWKTASRDASENLVEMVRYDKSSHDFFPCLILLLSVLNKSHLTRSNCWMVC